MTITGKDKTSKLIIESLKSGMKVKDIPGKFNVSIDQAKRLSRYVQVLATCEKELDEKAYDSLQELGLKALYLYPLIKVNDFEGLAEVLCNTNKDTKRDDLPLFIAALEEKRRRIADFKKSYEMNMKRIRAKELQIKQNEKAIREALEQVTSQIQFIRNYPEHVQKFLLEHLGISNGKIVLAKRLDSLWQKSLKNKSILSLDEYLWVVNDLDALIEDFEKRTNRKKPYNCVWNWGLEEKRYENSPFGLPGSEYYKNADGLFESDLQSEIESAEKRIKEINEKKKQLQKEMKNLRKSTPQSFFEAVEASNTLSSKDLKRHGELQQKALKWLYNQGYIVAGEVTLPNGRRVDVIGYNDKNKVIIIEVKVSAQDFLNDDKWEKYLDCCDEFYFLLENPYEFYRNPKYNNVGLITEIKKDLHISREDTLHHDTVNKADLIMRINKTLARKYVLGY